jgi:drug/metabolite transporter (DMT)-like permease
MSEILRKLSSRKLWMAIAGIVTGIAMALGADTSEVSEVAGAVTALVSVVAYIVTEGKIDAEGVKNAIIEIQDGLEIIEGTDGE